MFDDSIPQMTRMDFRRAVGPVSVCRLGMGKFDSVVYLLADIATIKWRSS